MPEQKLLLTHHVQLRLSAGRKQDGTQDGNELGTHIAEREEDVHAVVGVGQQLGTAQ